MQTIMNCIRQQYEFIFDQVNQKNPPWCSSSSSPSFPLPCLKSCWESAHSSSSPTRLTWEASASRSSPDPLREPCNLLQAPLHRASTCNIWSQEAVMGNGKFRSQHAGSLDISKNAAMIVYRVRALWIVTLYSNREKSLESGFSNPFEKKKKHLHFERLSAEALNNNNGEHLQGEGLSSLHCWLVSMSNYSSTHHSTEEWQDKKAF